MEKIAHRAVFSNVRTRSRWSDWPILLFPRVGLLSRLSGGRSIVLIPGGSFELFVDGVRGAQVLSIVGPWGHNHIALVLRSVSMEFKGITEILFSAGLWGLRIPNSAD